MIESIFYAFLAILGLGFLVFIHELGHYWVARRQGMKVEAFAIGFGKPIYTWERDGVKWQICWLPFGGYVRIAGMQKEGSREPYEIHDGFYGKKPWQRIKVALAGPLVNIFFALFVFTLLWMSGGREKSFSEFTHRIGWVDPASPLYAQGVRSGDVIQKYDGRPFHGFKDLLVASLMDHETSRIEGYKINYTTGKRSNFDYTLKTYEDPQSGKDPMMTIGVVSPAQYLIYRPSTTPIPSSPISQSGIEPNDRLLWVDGEIVFSAKQLGSLVNESTTFLTVQRGDEIFHTKVPRIHIDDLKMSPVEKAEIDDWQHEAGLKGRLQDLYFIPYTLSPKGEVENRLSFIDEEDQIKAFQKCKRCAYFHPLQEGDRILAIDGEVIQTSYELLQKLQTRHILIIVLREPTSFQSGAEPISWHEADTQFDAFNTAQLQQLVDSIGTSQPLSSLGNFHLLRPIVPQPLFDLQLPQEQKEQLVQEYTQVKKEIEGIKDPQKRSLQLRELERSQRKLVLGIPLTDREVRYNPSPIAQFSGVLEDTWRTLSGLVSGVLNPKYVSGPVGIVHVVHNSWMLGAREALFWMAVISLNLGIINLLPIPVLDGGHIMFSLFEAITHRRLRSKTMERLIIPFIGLLIVFFLYITYQDISRLFSKFF